MFSEEVLKFNITSNPQIIQLPQNLMGGNKTFTIDQFLAETTTLTPPKFIKIHYDGAAFFDSNLNKTTEVEMVSKSNVWGSLIQYYMPYDQSKEHVGIGISNSITLMLTDENNNALPISDYGIIHLVMRIYILK